MILRLLNAIRPGWVAEHRFASPRKWRFDFAHEEIMVAVEIEGGLWIRGRHNRPKSMIADMEKYNTATILGWRLLRYTPQQVPEMMRDVKKLLRGTDEKT